MARAAAPMFSGLRVATRTTKRRFETEPPARDFRSIRTPQLRVSLEANPRNSMRFRSNESCPIHQSLFCCGRERLLKRELYDPVFSVSRIHIIHILESG